MHAELAFHLGGAGAPGRLAREVTDLSPSALKKAVSAAVAPLVNEKAVSSHRTDEKIPRSVRPSLRHTSTRPRM